MRTFTFDNIDVVLDQHPGVGLEQVQGKFVGRGRGGYCFEHGTLFAAVLERLGYAVTRRLGRVGPPETTARTHCVVVVDLDGELLLADPGFGMSLLRTIPLADGATDDFGGWSYRLREVRAGEVRAWELSRWRDEQWELMHTHDELPVQPPDLVSGHHYTSTFPASHFRHMLMVTKHGEGGTRLADAPHGHGAPAGPADRAPRDRGGRAARPAARARGAAHRRGGGAAARPGRAAAPTRRAASRATAAQPLAVALRDLAGAPGSAYSQTTSG